MNKSLPLCPEHNLSIGSDYLCSVCRFQLQNITVHKFGRYSPEESTIPKNVSRDQWFVMGWKKRLSVLKEAGIIDVEDEESQQKK